MSVPYIMHDMPTLIPMEKSENKKNSIRTTPFLLFALFASGLNGLVMEIVFRRELLLLLGVTHYSLGTVLAVFMAGLALGSFLCGRIIDRIIFPVRLYGILEIGVGLSGLLLIPLLPFLHGLAMKIHGAVGAAGSPSILLKALLAAAVLIVPTTFMGGTLPVVGKALAQGRRTAAPSLGLLYGLNTIGGVLGVLGATFWFLDKWGANITLVSVCLGNVLIGVTAFRVFGKAVRVDTEPFVEKPPKHPAPSAESYFSKPTFLPLLAFFVSGFSALSLEVHWTRILAYVIGSHGYAFGLILAGFLTGIALGSLILSSFVNKIRRPLPWLGAILILLGASSGVVSLLFFNMRGLTGWLTVNAAGSWARFITLEMVVLFGILLVPTLCMGAAFPLVMAAVTRDYSRLGNRVGTAYALNTVGSILGASLAGFVIIPLMGISWGLKVTILAPVATGLILFLFPENRIWFKAGAGAAAGALIVLILLGPSGQSLQPLRTGERLIFYDESSSATVAVREDGDGTRMLSINGLDEVPVDPASLLTFRTLAHMPLLMHPDPRRVMVLALGGGITTGSTALHPLEQIDVVELCPPVVIAARYFSRWNHGVLDDPRLRVILQDGRNHLLTTSNTYDVITADATHPWSADSWILYTREMYRLVRSRLSSNGLFCQWIPLHWMSREDFQCILRTMRSVFPYMSLWYTGSYVVAVGSLNPQTFDLAALGQRMAQKEIRQDLESVGIDSPESLLGLHILNEDGIDAFVGDGPLNTDDRAYLEHSAARCFGRETTPENLEDLTRVRSLTASLLVSGTGKTIEPGFDDRLNRIFRARENTMLGRKATYTGHFDDAVELYGAALQEAPDDGVTRIFLADVKSTQAASVGLEGDQARRSGRLKEALSAYNRALEIDPTEARSLNGIGLICFGQGKYREALVYFNKALDRQGKQVQIRYNRALALLKLGAIEEAGREMTIIERLEEESKPQYAPRLREIIGRYR